MNEYVSIILDATIDKFVNSIVCNKIGKVQPEVDVEYVTPEILKYSISFDLEEDVYQDNWELNITPSFTPDFHWSPHLTPMNDNVVDQHSFRSPALIVHNKKKVLMVVPDLDIMSEGTPVNWYLDMDAEENKLVLGMSNTVVEGHVLYRRIPGAFYPKGQVKAGFYIFILDDEKSIQNPWRVVLDFLWNNYGKRLYHAGQPLKGSLEHYIKYTYDWAFNKWEKHVWQEFELDGKKVGAPCFIVNVTQSPNYKGIVSEREFRSVWNQAWFSSLRSAFGLYLYGNYTNNKELKNRALMTKELTLSFPQKQGFFPTVIATEMETVDINGVKVNRSKGWDTYYWGNSNRNPYSHDVSASPYHVLDMSWTSLLMLRWYEELEKDTRLLDYAVNYADALIQLQDEKGFFPAWIDKDTLKPLDILNHSPETSLSITFFLYLFNITGKEKYLEASLKAVNSVCKEIIYEGRWEDFETYWSCCTYGNKELVGKKVKRNNMYKQCNFSIFWTAEALYYCYKTTREKKYLERGQRCLDEMLMTQASWQPPYIPINTLGGFGVMNCDGEWNDARQSLFAELIIQYGLELNKPEYIQRGLSALRASFVMMYCPENEKTKQQWEKKWPFFNENDYGFTMENYGHCGEIDSEGKGMGEFTIYDWGNGAAAESYMRMMKHYGRSFIEEH